MLLRCSFAVPKLPSTYNRTHSTIWKRSMSMSMMKGEEEKEEQDDDAESVESVDALMFLYLSY